MTGSIDEEEIVSEHATEPGDAGPEYAPMDGLIARLQRRGHDLALGRRLNLSLPGWDDLGDGRGLWARCKPLTRDMQLRFAGTPDNVKDEIDYIVPLLVACTEEILIGTEAVRTALADEPEVKARIDPGVPLRFDPFLGDLLGVGGTSPDGVVKRMLIRGDDDVALYAVWGELLNWSGSVHRKGVETAAGE